MIESIKKINSSMDKLISDVCTCVFLYFVLIQKPSNRKNVIDKDKKKYNGFISKKNY